MAHSLEDLLFYRSTYAQCIEASLRGMSFDEVVLEKYAKKEVNAVSNVAKITRLSLLAENTWIAAVNPVKSMQIANEFFEKLKSYTGEAYGSATSGGTDQDLYKIELEESSEDEISLEVARFVESSTTPEVDGMDLNIDATQRKEECKDLLGHESLHSIRSSDNLLPSSVTCEDQEVKPPLSWIREAFHHTFRYVYKGRTGQGKVMKKPYFRWTFPTYLWRRISHYRAAHVWTAAKTSPPPNIENEVHASSGTRREAPLEVPPQDHESEREEYTPSPAPTDIPPLDDESGHKEDDSSLALIDTPSEPISSNAKKALPNPPEPIGSWRENFTIDDVSEALADDTLDEARMRRLKDEFDKVVASVLR